MVLQAVENEIQDLVLDENWRQLRFYRHLLHDSNAESGINRVSNCVACFRCLLAQVLHYEYQPGQNILPVCHQVFNAFESASNDANEAKKGVLHGWLCDLEEIKKELVTDAGLEKEDVVSDELVNEILTELRRDLQCIDSQ